MSFFLWTSIIGGNIYAQSTHRTSSKSYSTSPTKSSTYEVGGTKYISGETYKTTGQPKVERSASSRKEFLKSQGYSKEPSGYQVDHVVPLSHGGRDVPSNMQLITVDQHKQKTATERHQISTTNSKTFNYSKPQASGSYKSSWINSSKSINSSYKTKYITSRPKSTRSSYQSSSINYSKPTSNSYKSSYISSKPKSTSSSYKTSSFNSSKPKSSSGSFKASTYNYSRPKSTYKSFKSSSYTSSRPKSSNHSYKTSSYKSSTSRSTGSRSYSRGGRRR